MELNCTIEGIMVAHVNECSEAEEEGEIGNYPAEFPTQQKTHSQIQHHCQSEGRKTVGEKLSSRLKLGSKCSNMAAREADSNNCTSKKKKKFKPADNLCCVSILDSRYDHDDTKVTVQDGREYISLNQREIESNICWDEDSELAADIFTHGRASFERKVKPPKLHKQLKEIQFNTNLAKHSRTGNKAIKVKYDIYSRKTQRDDVINEHIQAKKANIEKNLKSKNIERRGKKEVTFAKSAQQTTPANDRKIRKKGRWSHDRIEERRFQWEVYPYALVEEVLEVEHSDKSDPQAQLMWTLIQLQNRELTPEDYDLLLRLDEQIAAKTVSTDKLKTLKTQVLSDSDLSTSTIFEDPCMVCMEEYLTDQKVKFLPCKHVFHELCIDNWLANAGNKCPLDGLEVVL